MVFKQRKKFRFDIWQPDAGMDEIEQNGLIANQLEYDLATPSSKRNETITLVASNSCTSNESLYVQFKWRPDENNPDVVTLVSKLTFVVGADVYDSGEHYETYRPVQSKIRLGRITQYGSNASKMKLIIASPHRRMRLVFNGHVIKRPQTHGEVEEQNGELVYLKLACVISPLMRIFDFIDQYDTQLYNQLKSANGKANSSEDDLNRLIFHDRHDIKVRLNGEYMLVGNNLKIKNKLALWSFYSRHFAPLGESKENNQIDTKRIVADINNGQCFHVGQRKCAISGQQVEVGFTCFDMLPVSRPIDGFTQRLNWDEIDEQTQKFDFVICCQGRQFECEANRRNSQVPLFELTMNKKKGWAWLLASDQIVDSSDEQAAIEQSRKQRQLLCDAGLFFQPKQLDPNDNSKLLVVALDDDKQLCRCTDLVGSKAASLAELITFSRSIKSAPDSLISEEKANASEFTVPNGFVVTRFAHDLIMDRNKHIRDKLAELQSLVVNETPIEDLKSTCEEIAKMVKTTELPDEIKSLLTEMLQTKYDSDKLDKQVRFAVRSSSWGEDEEGMSAAGQLNTILNVRGLDNIFAATMECFASKFSLENVEYKRQHGLPLNLPMAVAIQEMVDCEKAGVMFTCDPTTGDDSVLLITANYGLGESVVSAQADPDSIRVRVSGLKDIPTLSIEKIDVGQKKVVITSEQDGGQQFDKSKCCLLDGEVIRLARCGLELRNYFATGQRDIEWGYMNGQLYLFQSRPVTSLEQYSNEELLHELDKPLAAEKPYYTRANLNEVMPFGFSPFGISVLVPLWRMCMFDFVASRGLDHLPYVTTQVSWEQQHSFFNVRSSIMINFAAQERSILHKSMEIGLFGREMGDQAVIAESSEGMCAEENLFQGSHYVLSTWKNRIMPERTVMSEYATLKKLRSDTRGLKLANGYNENKMIGLFNQYKRCLCYLKKIWLNNIYVIFKDSEYHLVLTMLLSKYFDDPLKLTSAGNKILTLTKDVLSAEIPVMIRKMAQTIKSRGSEEVEKFIKMDDKQALEYVRKSSDLIGDQLSKEFELFMETFGHRGYHEFDVHTTVWREDPTQVVKMLKQNCMPNQTTSDTENSESEHSKTKATIDQVIDSLDIKMSFGDKCYLKYILGPRSQLFVSLRERSKDLLILHTDILREATRMLADEMRRQARIPDSDLFFYLTVDEIDPLIRDHQPALVVQASKRRHMARREFSVFWKFDEIITDIVPYHKKQISKLDESVANAPKLCGTPASSGTVRAKCCLVNGFEQLDKVRQGTILVTYSTDIAFSPVFPLLAGVITEVGGLISHGAVVAREYGLPCVIGIPNVTRILQDGEEILLDAETGTIVRLDMDKNFGQADGTA